jgi:hypothetical protein
MLYAQKLATHGLARRPGEFPDTLAAVAHEDDRFHERNVQNSRHNVKNFVYYRISEQWTEMTEMGNH